VFGAAAVDADVHALALFKSNGDLLFAHGELAGGPVDDERAELTGRWAEMSQRLAGLLGDAQSTRIVLDENEYEGLAGGIVRGVPRKALAHQVWLWRFEPTARRLDRIAEQTRALATRLGKKSMRVVTEPNGLRLDAAKWAPFWSSFVHVIRNSVDHGIEQEAERLAAGKGGSGTTPSARTSQGTSWSSKWPTTAAGSTGRLRPPRSALPHVSSPQRRIAFAPAGCDDCPAAAAVGAGSGTPGASEIARANDDKHLAPVAASPLQTRHRTNGDHNRLRVGYP